jgi:hypothetical protein
MKPMSDVLDETGYEMPVGSWPRVPFLKQRFRHQRHRSKGNNYTIKAPLFNRFDHLPWSDPEWKKTQQRSHSFHYAPPFFSVRICSEEIPSKSLALCVTSGTP